MSLFDRVIHVYGDSACDDHALDPNLGKVGDHQPVSSKLRWLHVPATTLTERSNKPRSLAAATSLPAAAPIPSRTIAAISPTNATSRPLPLSAGLTSIRSISARVASSAVRSLPGMRSAAARLATFSR